MISDVIPGRLMEKLLYGKNTRKNVKMAARFRVPFKEKQVKKITKTVREVEHFEISGLRNVFVSGNFPQFS